MVNDILQVLTCLKLYRVELYILFVIFSNKVTYKGCKFLRVIKKGEPRLKYLKM